MSFITRKYWFFSLLTTIFIIFSYFYFDKPIAYYFIDHAKEYDALGTYLSIFGESYWEFSIAIIGFLFFRFFKKNELYVHRFLFLLYSNIFSGFLSLLLKNLFGRMRPWGLKDGSDEYGFLLFQNLDMGLIEKFKYQMNILIDCATPHISFPSGHSTTLFTVATYLWLLFPKQKYIWFITASILATGRILASDHYLSDIIAGALLGILSTHYLYSKLKDKIA
jgi:membrane-associated phospholipid phosphatase